MLAYFFFIERGTKYATTPLGVDSGHCKDKLNAPKLDPGAVMEEGAAFEALQAGEVGLGVAIAGGRRGRGTSHHVSPVAHFRLLFVPAKKGEKC